MHARKISDQKKWFLKTILFMFFLLLTTGFLNYAIDSVGIFSEKNELKKAAHSLLNGKMIGGLTDYDDRQFQEQIIENSGKKFNIIFVGSSRGMQTRQAFLRFGNGSQSFFNHGMSGSSLEDYIAIIGLYKNKGYLPSKIIIGVDPWIFNKNSGQLRWKSVGKYYKKILGEIYGTKVEVDLSDNSKYLQLINFDYTKANLKTITTLSKKNKFYITNTIEVDDTIREPDGSINYPFNLKVQKDLDTQISAKLYANAPVYSLENFNKLSNTKLFEDFITYLQQNNTEVMLILPPYHPITYNLLVRDPRYKIIMDVEIYLKNLASSRKLRISGSYNPQNYKFSSVDFIDGMHSKDIVMEKLCVNLRDGTAQSAETGNPGNH